MSGYALVLGILYSCLLNPAACAQSAPDVRNHFVKIQNAILVLSEKVAWNHENVTELACAEKCWADRKCLSFEMTKGRPRCFFAQENAVTFREIKKTKSRNYYQKVKPNDEFIVLKRGSIPREDNLGLLKNMDLKGCKFACREHPECTSFEFKEENKRCDLSNVTHLTNDISPNRWGWDIYILNPAYKNIDCGPPQEISNAVKLYDTTSYESEVTYICPMGEQFTATCEMDNKWTSANTICKEPVSCKDIQKCGKNVTNGEYWIYPSVLNQKKMKIYCHHMETDNPREYITLPHQNFAFVPALKPFHLCINRFDEKKSKPGKTIFQKVRIYPEEMVLDRFDFTFTTLEKGKGNYKRGFGAAEDCLYGQSSYCKSQGQMKVDLRGTGLVVADSVKWVTYGKDARISAIVYSENNQVVTATCGGKCGGCKPEKQFKVELGSQEPQQFGVRTCAYLRQKHCSQHPK